MPTSGAGLTNSPRGWGRKVESWKAVMGLASLLWSFQGRISRAEFWLGALLSYVVAVPILVCVALTIGIEPATFVVSIILIFLLVPLHAKRYHDLGHSGWWALISFVPFGAVWTLIQCGCVKATAATNP